MTAIPPIPPELCGINSCAYTPHPNNTQHTWSTRRIYSTDMDGVGIRREPDHATREELEKAGRKVFETKGGEG